MLSSFRHRVVCEISQNIRYQYILIIMWFFFAVGIFVSILGFLHSVMGIIKAMFWIYRPKFFPKESLSDKVTAQLTIREMEYLEKIKSIDLTVYGELLIELTRYRPDLNSVKRYGNSPNGEALTLLPSAPTAENPVWYSFRGNVFILLMMEAWLCRMEGNYDPFNKYQWTTTRTYFDRTKYFGWRQSRVNPAPMEKF